jgi:hypothetical protein
VSAILRLLGFGSAGRESKSNICIVVATFVAFCTDLGVCNMGSPDFISRRHMNSGYWNRTRDLLSVSTVPGPTMLSHAPTKHVENIKCTYEISKLYIYIYICIYE